MRPAPGEWLDVYGLPARVVAAPDGRLVVDVYRGGPPDRRTFTAPLDGPFPPLPPDRIPADAPPGAPKE